MSVALTKGGNVSLGRQAPGLATALVGLGWTADPAYELDASALLCDRDGRVLSDQHFVFFNNLRSPDGSVWHLGGPAAGGDATDQQRIEVELTAVPAEVEKVVFAVALYEAAQRRQSFARVRSAYIRITDPGSGLEIARYQLADEPRTETAMVFGELYRHSGDWKFRAVGQGYASGLAGIAADYGVVALQPAAEPADEVRTAVPTTAPAAPARQAPPAAPARPAPAPVPPVVTEQAMTGSSAVTCFFDPSHGAGGTAVIWTPQWGVPRQIQACAVCAQRVQTTVPPFYTPPQQQAGYPQQIPLADPRQGAGYPQGYPQPGQVPPDQQRRYGTGALIGAGVAGVVGGILLDEAFSDDRPDVVVNNYYEDDGDFF
ncbi:TerD family protein [Kitasatospora humi]|uniref:TerD family protein n=1 Tax=Kitasatospora humi TaxID=2893891 RepID=UPI0024C0D267|nr:TerD family protein [Kitasatospora humi]